MTNSGQWYVIWCQTGAELDTLMRVRDHGITEAIAPVQMLPYRRRGSWIPRSTVMIPSYVFVRCVMDERIYHLIKSMPKVIRWLGRDGCWPETVPEDQMTHVLALEHGIPPECILTNVRINHHKRRGYGILTLDGTDKQIVFCPACYRQTDDQPVDKCPDDQAAE